MHEYRSQEVFRKYNITVPDGEAASTPEEVSKVFARIANTDPAKGPTGAIIKSQVLAGGRGRGHFDTGFEGGVHAADSAEEAADLAAKMLGNRLITKQTGAEGLPVNHLLVAKKHEVAREMYFAILLDRAFGGPVMVGSAVGGMGIEDLAEEHPDAIFKIPVDADNGPTAAQAEEMARSLGFESDAQVQDCAEQIQRYWTLFSESDVTMMEINPLAEEAGTGRVMAFDAKMNFDDNAAFRQKEIFAMADHTQEDPREVDAAKFDLNYIGLDGNIGCLVNGAGLAMSTMDIIKLYGGEPANFLDVGGGATKSQVKEAVRILAEDPKVKCILVNIFGGIMRCDVIAAGLVAAVAELDISTPLIVRLQGTNVDEAKFLIQESALRIIATDDLDDAAQKAVKVADIIQIAREGKLGVEFSLPM